MVLPPKPSSVCGPEKEQVRNEKGRRAAARHLGYHLSYVLVVELADTCGLGPHAERLGGSNPLGDTKMFSSDIRELTKRSMARVKHLEKLVAEIEEIVRGQSRDARTVHVKTYWDEDLIGCKNARQDKNKK